MKYHQILTSWGRLGELSLLLGEDVEDLGVELGLVRANHGGLKRWVLGAGGGDQK